MWQYTRFIQTSSDTVVARLRPLWFLFQLTSHVVIKKYKSLKYSGVSQTLAGLLCIRFRLHCWGTVKCCSLATLQYLNYDYPILPKGVLKYKESKYRLSSIPQNIDLHHFDINLSYIPLIYSSLRLAIEFSLKLFRKERLC